MLALALLATTPARGQEGATFGSVGPLGIGASDGGSAFAVHAAIGHAFGHQVISGRAAAALTEGDFLWDDVWDVALIWGLASRRSTSFSSFGAGLGYVGGTTLGQSSNTFGLALEAQAFRQLWKGVGIGLYAFGNFNKQNSFGGVTLALRFGQR